MIISRACWAARGLRMNCISRLRVPAPLAIRSVATAPAPSKSNAPTPTSSSSELEHGIASVRWAWTFLWDQADPALRFRVGTTFALMIGSKLIAIQVPFLFKHAVDGLSDPQLTMALTPATLLLLYGATRATAEGVGQMRNALFAAQRSRTCTRSSSASTFRAARARSLVLSSAAHAPSERCCRPRCCRCCPWHSR